MPLTGDERKLTPYFKPVLKPLNPISARSPKIGYLAKEWKLRLQLRGAK
jgi:hypothetical protein